MAGVVVAESKQTNKIQERIAQLDQVVNFLKNEQPKMVKLVEIEKHIDSLHAAIYDNMQNISYLETMIELQNELLKEFRKVLDYQQQVAPTSPRRRRKLKSLSNEK